MPHPQWRWAAFGKHPVASDFFRFGEDIPLTKGFSDWVKKGYETLTSKKNGSPVVYAWRFWVRSPQKGSIACGVIRDSSDSLGRPYPLLIIGTGPLPDWEANWDFLPFACEGTWNQIEYLSSLVANDFKRLEADVYRIKPPQPDWSDFDGKRRSLGSHGPNSNTNDLSSNLRDMEEKASSASDRAELIVHLDQNPLNDQFAQVSLWHYLLKNHTKAAPYSIFMGGTVERVYLALFRRALTTGDFVQLWSLSFAG